MTECIHPCNINGCARCRAVAHEVKLQQEDQRKMPIDCCAGYTPGVEPAAFVHPAATLIGDAIVGTHVVSCHLAG